MRIGSQRPNLSGHGDGQQEIGVDPLLSRGNGQDDGILCHARKMPVGVSLGLGDDASLVAWKNRGVDFMSVGNEYAFLMAQIAALRKLLQG